MNDLWKKITGSLLIVAGIITGGISIAVSINVDVDVNKPPVPVDELGWAGPEAVAEVRDEIESLPKFQIVGDAPGRDYENENVRLWDFVKQVNGGNHLPNIAQQIGDCVSWGAANAMNFLQAKQLALDGQHARFRPVYPPYIYGTSRVQVGNGRLGCNSDGSVGYWAAVACRDYGLLPIDAEGVPPYSGKVAKEWGCKGPPQKFLDAALPYRIKSFSQINTADDARKAICNGYPITIASQFGTRTIREADGKMVARWDGSWSHQMCICAYDGSGRTKYFYVLNSWGPRAHPNPIGDEPPGGFWITFETLDRIVKSRDCFAFSDFEGFPAADDDFHFWIAEHREIPVIGQHAQEDIPMSPTSVLAFLSVFLIAAGASVLFSHRRPLATGLFGVMLAACVVGSSIPHAHAEDFSFALFELKNESGIAAESTATDFNFQMTTATDDFDFLMVSAKQSTLPANVHVFGPDWCGVCKSMQARLGSGGDGVRIQYHDGDESKFPGFVQQRGARDGYPVIHFQKPDGKWMVTSRTRSLDQLKEMVMTGVDAVIESPRRVEIATDRPTLLPSGCQYVMSGGRMMLVCPSP